MSDEFLQSDCLDYEGHKLIPMVRTERVVLAFLLLGSVVGSMKTRFIRAGNKVHLAAIHSDVYILSGHQGDIESKARMSSISFRLHKHALWFYPNSVTIRANKPTTASLPPK